MRIQLSIIVLILPGCGQPTDEKIQVCRLQYSSTTDLWTFRIDNGDIVRLSDSRLLGTLKEIQFVHGDLIIAERMAGVASDGFTKTWVEVLRLSASSRVACYLLSSENSTDLFRIPIYHWIAPFDNPRNLADASFYREGLLLGFGNEGYHGMTEQIELEQSPKILVLGSQYDQDSGFGTNEVPFEDDIEALNSAASKAKVEVITLSGGNEFLKHLEPSIDKQFDILTNFFLDPRLQ